MKKGGEKKRKEQNKDKGILNNCLKITHVKEVEL
jgi:hypothetical protein